jgi:hypothetical protein
MKITANQKKALPYRIMKDGREIVKKTAAGSVEYRRRISQMWHRDHGRCCLCGIWLHPDSATFEHKRSRGMGGGTRDDRIEVNGISHYLGNAAKGSMSYERYMELSPTERLRNCGRLQ